MLFRAEVYLNVKLIIHAILNRKLSVKLKIGVLFNIVFESFIRVVVHEIRVR